MKSVSEVSNLTGVSIRTLHHYDKIGLLKPSAVTEAGYRLYDDVALERLQYILLYRELEFALKEIREILDSRDFDRNRILDQQIQLLILKKEHIENLITFARGIRLIGVKNMDFAAFNTKEIDDYAAQAKALYGKTDAYKEFEQKTENMSKDQVNQAGLDMMKLFVEFGKMRELDPQDAAVQEQVKKLQDYITEHFYTCTDEILAGLGAMYRAGGSMTENIDRAGGAGTAEFVTQAIKYFCR